MKTMMVDMDEVLGIGGYLEIVNKFLNTNYTINDLPGYYTEDLIPKDRLEEYYQFYATQNVYDYTELIPNAMEVLEKLSKKYEIFICTAYFSESYDREQSQILVHKYKWLQKNFPFISPLHYIFINQKHLLECDIKIDDRLSNLKGYGKQKFLFDSYHNKKVTEEELKEVGAVRVSGWKEIEEILLEEDER